MSTYDDKSLLFITSTDAQVPQGRNARAQHRAKTAARAAPAKGKFATLDLRPTDTNAKADRNDEAQTRKRRRQEGAFTERKTPAGPKSHFDLSRFVSRGPSSPLAGSAANWTLPFINPAEILIVATFHVRRMAVMAMQSELSGLTKALRCRQWSCMPFAFSCFGKDPCVDSAVLCVADRIRFLSGCPFSPVSMMKHYSTALRSVQNAIDEPSEHNPQDVLAAVQLLAIYEMLDSLDNHAWAQHIAGAATMIQTYTSITTERLEKWESRGCGNALPMFADALLSRDAHFFRTYPWRELLRAISAKIVDPPEGIQDLMRCIRLMPNLVLDVDVALSDGEEIGFDHRFGLLDRAHDIRHRIRTALRGNQLYTECYYREMLSNFDFLGTFLSALVALDRIIAALRPASEGSQDEEQDPSGLLCAQLLELELGASAHYPSTEVLAGFQRAGLLDTPVHTSTIAKG